MSLSAPPPRSAGRRWLARQLRVPLAEESRRAPGPPPRESGKAAPRALGATAPPRLSRITLDAKARRNITSRLADRGDVVTSYRAARRPITVARSSSPSRLPSLRSAAAPALTAPAVRRGVPRMAARRAVRAEDGASRNHDSVRGLSLAVYYGLTFFCVRVTTSKGVAPRDARPRRYSGGYGSRDVLERNLVTVKLYLAISVTVGGLLVGAASASAAPRRLVVLEGLDLPTHMETFHGQSRSPWRRPPSRAAERWRSPSAPVGARRLTAFARSPAERRLPR